MFCRLFSVVFLVYFISVFNDKTEASVGKNASGYVTVRPDAHMFWLLYFANTSDSNHPDTIPLVIFLNGGPGVSSTGFGNFEEIGPLKLDLNPRKATWLHCAHLLFIDNPVGTGYSYVTNDSVYATNNTQIAKDLVTLLKAFLKKMPEFQSNPLYIFGESYGGKMTVTFAVELYHGIQSKEVKSNFQGIALGDSWIAPADIVASWGQYLYSFSFIDANERKQVNTYAQRIRIALKNNQDLKATDIWGQTEDFIDKITGDINFYNVLDIDPDDAKKSEYYSSLSGIETNMKNQLLRHLGRSNKSELYKLMNGVIKRELHIPEHVTWGGQSNQVFNKLRADFMLPVVNQIDFLLISTDIKVAVYSGQLDLICDILGTLDWIRTLKWPGLEKFQKSPMNQIVNASGYRVAFTKSYETFSMYRILNAGHSVPEDAPNTALLMLKQILFNTTNTNCSKE